jgi:hypothetical protein
VGECVVCGHATVPYSIYCPRCRWYVFWHGSGHRAYAAALREAYDPVADGFVCRYTGVLLDPEMGRPWSLNFDHRISGDEESRFRGSSSHPHHHALTPTYH